jgi:hypothetical protein
MVQDASQVMHDIPYEQTQCDSWQLRGVGNFKDVVSRLRVELTPESYAVRFVHEETVTDFFIEDVAMFPRPHELRATSVQRVAHD